MSADRGFDLPRFWHEPALCYRAMDADGHEAQAADRSADDPRPMVVMVGKD
jgi:hypothetical protein